MGAMARLKNSGWRAKSIDNKKIDRRPKSDDNQVYKSPRYLHWSQIWLKGGTTSAEYAATYDSMFIVCR